MIPKKWIPHDYQRQAVKLLVQSPVSALFMKPGRGKTTCVLAAAKTLLQLGYLDTVLVVAPKRACYLVWPMEVEKWEEFRDLKLAIVHGAQFMPSLNAKAQFFITTPESLQKALTAPGFLKRLGRCWLVLDESSKYRNQKSQRWRFVDANAHLFQRRTILTGSPSPNGLINLWAQVYLLDRGTALGRYISTYRNAYFDFAGDMWIPKHNADAAIARQLAPISCTVDTAPNTPQWVNNPIQIALPPEVIRHHWEIAEHLLTLLDSGEAIESPNAAAALMKMRQIASGAVYREDRTDQDEYIKLHTAKLDAALELVEELSGAPLLLLYQFEHEWDQLRKLPWPGRVENLSHAREKDLRSLNDAFNAGEITVLAGHPRSMGFALNLQEASRDVLFYSPTWDLEEFEQAAQRVVRQGNPHAKVMVHHFLSKGTVDPVIYARVLEKDLSQARFLALLLEAERLHHAG